MYMRPGDIRYATPNNNAMGSAMRSFEFGRAVSTGFKARRKEQMREAVRERVRGKSFDEWTQEELQDVATYDREYLDARLRMKNLMFREKEMVLKASDFQYRKMHGNRLFEQQERRLGIERRRENRLAGESQVKTRIAESAEQRAAETHDETMTDNVLKRKYAASKEDRAQEEHDAKLRAAKQELEDRNMEMAEERGMAMASQAFDIGLQLSDIENVDERTLAFEQMIQRLVQLHGKRGEQMVEGITKFIGQWDEDSNKPIDTPGGFRFTDDVLKNMMDAASGLGVELNSEGWLQNRQVSASVRAWTNAMLKGSHNIGLRVLHKGSLDPDKGDNSGMVGGNMLSDQGRQTQGQGASGGGATYNGRSEGEVNQVLGGGRGQQQNQAGGQGMGATAAGQGTGLKDKDKIREFLFGVMLPDSSTSTAGQNTNTRLGASQLQPASQSMKDIAGQATLNKSKLSEAAQEEVRKLAESAQGLEPAAVAKAYILHKQGHISSNLSEGMKSVGNKYFIKKNGNKVEIIRAGKAGNGEEAGKTPDYELTDEDLAIIREINKILTNGYTAGRTPNVP